MLDDAVQFLSNTHPRIRCPHSVPGTTSRRGPPLSQAASQASWTKRTAPCGQPAPQEQEQSVLASWPPKSARKIGPRQEIEGRERPGVWHREEGRGWGKATWRQRPGPGTSMKTAGRAVWPGSDNFMIDRPGVKLQGRNRLRARNRIHRDPETRFLRERAGAGRPANVVLIREHLTLSLGSRSRVVYEMPRGRRARAAREEMTTGKASLNNRRPAEPRTPPSRPREDPGTRRDSVSADLCLTGDSRP